MSVRGASVSVGTGNVDSVTTSGMQCTVTLSGVSDQQEIIVTLQGTHDSTDYINVAVPMKIIFGDVNGSGGVTSADVSQVKLNSGMLAGPGNFQNDVDLNGTITATDVSIVKFRSGNGADDIVTLPRLEVCDPNNEPAKRFLCKHGQGQFFWLGDTAWWLMNVNDSDVSWYLAQRAAQGFTGIQIMALMLEIGPSVYLEGPVHNKNDFYNSSPLDSGGNPNPLCPSPYWARFKWIIDEAGRKGLYVGVFLVWGNEISTSHYFGTDTTKAHDYARDLATLLSNNTNVWYSVSGEYDAIHNYRYLDITNAEFMMFDSLAQGLLDGSQSSSILRGIHPGRPQTSVLQFAPGGGCGGSIPCHPVSWLEFHMLQSAHNSKRGDFEGGFIKQTDELIDQGYALADPKPIFDGEPIYENIVDGVYNRTTPPDVTGPNSPRADASIVRFKAYEAVFAGAFGHTYGHDNVHIFWTSGNNVDTNGQPLRPYTQGINWRAAVNGEPGAHGEGAQQLIHLRHLVECHSANRIPDQPMLPDEPASYEGLKHKRATREKGSAGRYALVYLPQGGGSDPLDNTVKVDVTNLATGWTAKWFNPENGISTNTTGTHTGNIWTFTTTGLPERSGPVKDWILVLDPPDFCVP